MQWHRIRSFFSSAFLSFKQFVQMILLKLFTLSINSNSRCFNRDFLALVKGVGLFQKSKTWNASEILSKWSRYHTFQNQGDFFLATKLRREVLAEIYDKNFIESGYYPPIIPEHFTGPIGHKAFLGIHLAAQKLGLIPRGNRFAIVKSDVDKDPLLNLYQDSIKFVKYEDGSGWTDLPSHWHIVESPLLIRGFDGFIESYELVDEVFRTQKVSRESAHFSLEPSYIEKSSRMLERFGFTESDWFVGLHIRDGNEKPALRNQQISNYLPAIREITNRGGWVIRIGAEHMPPLPRMHNVIDLVQETDALREFHLFVLACGLFFIGTCSGPQYFPPLFGVPTLFTNQIGSGRSILTFSEHSIHLPKTYTDSDAKPASFTQMLSSPFGYGELTLEQYRKMGINIRENTSLEILEAVQEMFSRISGEVISLDQEFDFEIDRIRNLFPWTSKGRIANSFLRRNSDWFLGDRNK